MRSPTNVFPPASLPRSILSAFRPLREGLVRALAVMRLQQAIATSCEALEEITLLTLMSVLVDTRHKWATRANFKEWSALVTKSQYKLIRGRPMAQPESRGLEALDPMEAAYRTYYSRELNQHNLDHLRQAATRIVGDRASASTLRVNTAQSEKGEWPRQKVSEVRTGDPAPAAAVHCSGPDEVPHHALHQWIRAATPPAGIMSAGRPNLTLKEMDAESKVGGTVLQRYEQENKRKEELLIAEMQARNRERKRMDELMITLRAMGGLFVVRVQSFAWMLIGFFVYLSACLRRALPHKQDDASRLM
jgi:hypothetical protein